MKGRAFIQGSALAITLVALGTACDEPISKIPTGAGFDRTRSDRRRDQRPRVAGARDSRFEFNASIRLADGAVKIATPGTVRNWRIGNSFYLQVNQAGIVTAQPRVGETTLTVEVRVGTQTRTATREIVILPEGTYRLVGKITEAGFPTQAVGGARVEVAQGSASTTSDFNGQYRLYGVPPSRRAPGHRDRLRGSRTGSIPDVSRHPQFRNGPVRPSADARRSLHPDY